MIVKTPIEQTLADWFKAKLAEVTAENGCSLTLVPDLIHTDGEPEPRKDPPVPRAVYDDDNGAWEEVEDTDAHGILAFEPQVRLLIAADYTQYKRRAREAWADVSRICRLSPFDEGASQGILSVSPVSWSRDVRDGNYCEITITFSVRADGSAHID